MNRNLRKGSSGMHVSYANSGFSNNLRGRNFEYRQLDGKHILHIDMSGNIRTRNKEENSYSDALELIENHHSLKRLEFDDNEKAMIEQVARLSGAPPTEWLLQLDFGDKGSFRYSIACLQSDKGCARFNVSFLTA